MSALACIGEPVSWLRLETFAAGKADPAITTHLAACPACAQCLAEITADVVALPVLEVPVRRARPWWSRFAPVMGLAAAAAVLALVMFRGRAPEREDRVRIKGVGEVVIDVVRERAGVVREDVRSYAAGDRWKVVVTCPPAGVATFGVVVVDGSTVDTPLAPAHLACGNRVVLPGAFSITGSKRNRVCVEVTAAEGRGTACVTLTPE